MKQQITILGGGESGAGAALLAQARGYEPFLSDAGTLQPKYREQLQQAGISFEEGGHTLEKVLAGVELIKSPGIPQTAPVIVAARKNGIPVISEIEFAARYTKARFVAITGTNGKTTTTLLTYHLLKEAGMKVGLAGNVGHSLAAQVIADENEVYVLELSSFQLENVNRFHADIAILTNITPDHLDRYEYDMGKYAEAKLRVTRNQTLADTFIYNSDDTLSRKYLAAHPVESDPMPFTLSGSKENGIFWDGGSDIIIQSKGKIIKVSAAASGLVGKHNQQNTMAAVGAAVALGVEPEEIERALATFRNAAHRLEPVAEINGVRWINDSKATNVEAVWFALDGINSPIVWIAGGVDKGNDYAALHELAKQKVKALVCLGKDNAKLLSSFKGIVPNIIDTNSLEQAIRESARLAGPGDVVLLSPACASFDLFRNYEHRGEAFKDEVQKLMQSVSGSEGAKSVLAS